MTIYSVFDPEFKPYGKVVPGYDTAELCRTLEAVTPLPEASGGGMDANRYNYNGMQSVELATGYIDNHTTNEHVFLDSFLRTGEMVCRTVLEYTAHPEIYNV